MNHIRYALKHKLAGLQVPILGGPLKGYRFGLLTGTRFVKGTYCAGEAQTLKELIRPGDVVYDIGAHVGYFSLLAASIVGDSGKVFAFEPHPLNLAYLQRHVKNNRLSNVQVMPYAVGGSPTTLWFDTGRGTGRGRLMDEEPESKAKTEVPVETLVTILAKGDVPGPNFIKMDIEGAEAQALPAAEEILLQYKPTILLSTHGPVVRQTCTSYLQSIGYELEEVNSWDFIARFK